jgi:hypothetical protein
MVADRQNPNAAFGHAEEKIVGEALQIGPLESPDTLVEMPRTFSGFQNLGPELQIEILRQSNER